jgi:hypothetical protein
MASYGAVCTILQEMIANSRFVSFTVMECCFYWLMKGGGDNQKRGFIMQDLLLMVECKKYFFKCN